MPRSLMQIAALDLKRTLLQRSAFGVGATLYPASKQRAGSEIELITGELTETNDQVIPVRTADSDTLSMRGGGTDDVWTFTVTGQASAVETNGAYADNQVQIVATGGDVFSDEACTISLGSTVDLYDSSVGVILADGTAFYVRGTTTVVFRVSVASTQNGESTSLSASLAIEGEVLTSQGISIELALGDMANEVQPSGNGMVSHTMMPATAQRSVVRQGIATIEGTERDAQLGDRIIIADGAAAGRWIVVSVSPDDGDALQMQLRQDTVHSLAPENLTGGV